MQTQTCATCEGKFSDPDIIFFEIFFLPTLAVRLKWDRVRIEYYYEATYFCHSKAFYQKLVNVLLCKENKYIRINY